jgi:hypothetical protein
VTFYRGPDGELCEAARFAGGHINDDYGLSFETKTTDFAWLTDAMNSGVLEISAFGSGLVLNFRGGSYGLVSGDWVIRRRGGEIVHCRGDQFEQRYKVAA